MSYGFLKNIGDWCNSSLICWSHFTYY